MRGAGGAVNADREWEVVIIGAGPVGLAVAGLLGKRGVRSLVLERKTEGPAHSQAIGITPPSLEILEGLGVSAEMVERGVRIRECLVHGLSGYVGTAVFREIGGRYPFILSLPQRGTVRLLERAVAEGRLAEIRRGVEVQSVEEEADGARVSYTQGGAGARWLRAKFVVACDGCHSAARAWLGVRTQRRDYGCHFVMGDFWDRTGWGDEARVSFLPQGAVESFPLPGGLRRWIVQTRERARMVSGEEGLIPRAVKERCGLDLTVTDQINQSAFSPWRLDCTQVVSGRMLLCGDAAHVMSPIGGQGMNVGFADAEHAAVILGAILRQGAAPGPLLAGYDRARRLSGRAAAGRAALGMWLGTWTGAPASILRDFILRNLIFRGPVARQVGEWFTMQSLPCNRFQQPSEMKNLCVG